MLDKTDSWRQAENIFKDLPHKQMQNISTQKNEHILSKKLALVTAEEMTTALGKQGVTNIRRITIRKCGEQIQTNIDPDI